MKSTREQAAPAGRLSTLRRHSHTAPSRTARQRTRRSKGETARRQSLGAPDDAVPVETAGPAQSSRHHGVFASTFCRRLRFCSIMDRNSGSSLAPVLARQGAPLTGNRPNAYFTRSFSVVALFVASEGRATNVAKLSPRCLIKTSPVKRHARR
jgi:hypothetical protein